MFSVALVALSLVEVATLVALGRPGTGVRRRLLIWAVGLGCAYDSAIFGLGAVVGAGQALETASWFRFLGHAVLTPLLVVWAAWKYADRPGIRRGAAAVTASLIVWGLVADVWGLRLTVRTWADTVRYAPEEAAVPLPALIVVVVLIVAGAIAWRRGGDAALLIGALVMFVAAGAGAAAPPLGNLGEAVLLAAIVVAERGTSQRRTADPAGRREA
ncbi:hypothetical protein OG225_18550 [Nocardia sp. NBC_01377]|uniref:hypothetical protein n=1 Tax=Nocardia sp. NBC_01377 TaxID=2903595 RepID=UPI00324F2F58